MNWTRKTVSRAAIAVAALVTGLVAAQAGSLKIESWRNDDADIWNSKIIPAFNKTYPDIKVEFAPSAEGIQRRPQRAPRRRHGWRHHRLSAVRRLA
jgi:ABC-type glycerol-3-phosphate transport system substrate-binding protein